MITARRVKIAILFTLCTFVFVGCASMSVEERLKGSNMKRVATKRAKTYVVEKYKFKPNIISVSAQKRVGGFFPYQTTAYYTGIVNVTCNYKGGKSFEVMVNLKSNDIADDYQLEEIQQDLLLFIQNSFSLNSHVVLQNINNYNFITSNIDLKDWIHGYWGRYDFYDGDMDEFIGKASESAVNSKKPIVLVFGVTADNKDDVIQQLSVEARSVQKLMGKRANLKLAFYDANEFSNDNIDALIQNYDEFSMRLMAKVNNICYKNKDTSASEMFEKVYDYTQFSIAKESDEGWDAIEVCGYTVNGEVFEAADRFYVSSSYKKDHWKTDATVLTNYFSDFGFNNDKSAFYPEQRYIRFNIAKMFPKETVENQDFVVLDARGKASGKAVTIAPSLRIGDYLYFNCVISNLYAIGIMEESQENEEEPPK